MGAFIGRIFRGDEPKGPSGAVLPGQAPRFLPGGEEPSFRATSMASGTDPRTGRRIFRSGVGISLGSQAEAQQLAEEHARQAIADAVAGHEGRLGSYAYANRRLEPVVETIRGTSGEAARVTVNIFGALVMNAASALFADVDLVDDERGARDDEPVPDEIGALVARRADLGFRLYRTRAGWRYLCTTRLFDPSSDETRQLLEELGADPKYVLLCRVQKTFRARLTPKPWRARHRALYVSPTEGIARADLQKYVDRTWAYATARNAGRLGRDEPLGELLQIIEYHDRWTQAGSDKPLA
jgi:hypothetical protein